MNHFPFTFSEVLDWTAAKHVLGRKGTPIREVSTDSRTISAGDLFIALKGPRYDGNDFVQEAVQKGSSALLVSRRPDPALLDEWRRLGVAVGFVEDGIKAIQTLASAYRKQFSVPVIGITGSCGKTTTKDITHAFLEGLGPVLKNEGTMNNHLGVPLTLLLLRPHHRAACLEMGTSSPGEIRHLVSIASPTVGTVLNVGPAHLKMLRDLEGVLTEKWDLIQGLEGGLGILNADDPLLGQRARAYPGSLFTFGIYQDAQVRASKIEFLKTQFMRFTLIFQGEEIGVVKVPFLGIHHIYNILAAMCMGRALGVDWDSMIHMASSLKLPSMRGEMIRVEGILVINDAYNANPKSMSAALETFHALRADGKKIFVCGGMLDLGDRELEWHRSLAQEILRAEVDILITVGPLAGLVAQEAREKGFAKSSSIVCENHEEALASLMEVAMSSDAVLVKGSRAMGMEKIVKGLMETLQKERRPEPARS